MQKDNVILIYLPCTKEGLVKNDFVFKIITFINDCLVSCNFIKALSITKGDGYKIMQKHVHYKLTKFSFNNRTGSIWNSLPDYVVSARSVSTFGKWLEFFGLAQRENQINWNREQKYSLV